MGLVPPNKVLHTFVGRPGNLVELDNEFVDGPDMEEDLVCAALIPCRMYAEVSVLRVCCAL